MEVSDYFADFEVSESHIPPPLTFSLFPFFPCPFFSLGGGRDGEGGGGGGGLVLFAETMFQISISS